MSNIIFPSSPSPNSTYNDPETGNVWRWNGFAWDYLGRDYGLDRVKFYIEINTETFDVTADMNNRFIDVDYPTEVTGTILETEGLPVGGITTFEQMGAGNILFVVENSSTMTVQKDKNKTSDDSDVVQLMRKEDISGVQQYRVIGGVE